MRHNARCRFRFFSRCHCPGALCSSTDIRRGGGIATALGECAGEFRCIDAGPTSPGCDTDAATPLRRFQHVENEDYCHVEDKDFGVIRRERFNTVPDGQASPRQAGSGFQSVRERLHRREWLRAGQQS